MLAQDDKRMQRLAKWKKLGDDSKEEGKGGMIGRRKGDMDFVKKYRLRFKY